MVIRYMNQPDNKVISEAHLDGSNWTNSPRWTEATVFDQRHPFNVSVSGDLGGSTVALQRSFDGVAWLDVWTTTEEAELVIDTVEEDVLWRCGMRTGDFNEDVDLHIRMSQWS